MLRHNMLRLTLVLLTAFFVGIAGAEEATSLSSDVKISELEKNLDGIFGGLKESISQLQSEVDVSRGLAESLKSENEALSQKLSEAQKAIAEKDKAIERLERMCTSLEESRDKVSSELNGKEAEFLAYRESADKTIRQLEERNKSDKDSAELRETKLQLQVAQFQVTELKIEQLKKDVEVLESEKAALSRKLNETEADFSAYKKNSENAIGNLESQFAEKSEELSTLSKDVAKITADYQTVLQEKERITLSHDEAVKENSRLSEELGKLSAKYKNAADTIECFFYDGGDVKQYFAGAEKFLRERAENGYDEAQFYLGYMLDPKHNNIKKRYNAIKQDTQQAKDMYRRAASNGHAMSLFYLANIYYDEGDYANAAELYKAVTEQGYPEARKALERMQKEGFAPKK